MSDDEAQGGDRMDVIDEERVLGKPTDLPWVEKYRPHSLDDLIAHEEIISICKCFFMVQR